MLAEGFDWVKKLAVNQTRLQQIHADKNGEEIAFIEGGTFLESRHFPSQPKNPNHTFSNYSGFVDYLTGALCSGSVDSPNALFVGADSVVAEFDYRDKHEQRVTLPLLASEEFSALMKLSRGVPQSELWRLLVTSLDGCIESTLLTSIAHVQIRKSSESEVEIDTSGMVSGSAGSRIGLTYPKAGQQGDGKTDMPTEYTFTGRIWECWDRNFSIDARLTIERDEDGLIFKLHPRRLAQQLRDARAVLKADLDDRLADKFYCVYEGEI